MQRSLMISSSREKMVKNLSGGAASRIAHCVVDGKCLRSVRAVFRAGVESARNILIKSARLQSTPYGGGEERQAGRGAVFMARDNLP